MRKSLLFCLAAATSLALASPVLAQNDQPSTTASSTSSAATVTGTVVSSSDNQLVIDTPTGRQTFTVVSGTSDVPTGLTAGTQVTVQFTTSGDQRTVSRVTTGTSTSSGTSPYSSSSSSSSTSPSASSTSPYSSSSTSTDRDRDNDSNRTGRRHHRAGTTDNDEHASTTGTTNNRLPATASPAFLVGLLGLLSLGGSAVLRALRRLL